MSGGHFNYDESRMEWVAEGIHNLLLDDFDTAIKAEDE